jgi:exopolysaccharide biosynthesis polyprenyl glycosylphosphotransferase
MDIASISNIRFQTKGKEDAHSKPMAHDISLKKYGFYGEEEFIGMLSRERYRSQRTNTPFILMLIDTKRILHFKSARANISTIASLIKNYTRESDIRGWYRNNQTLGIIFVGIEEKDIPLAMDVIAGKMKQKLASSLEMETVGMIGMSFHIFPEKYDVGRPDDSLEPELYPDLTKNTVSKMTATLLKRSCDVAGSIFGLVLFSPIFIIISILIKATSEGPIFFRQKRVGPFGRTFTFLKFRSMYVNNNDSIHREYIAKLIEGNKVCEQDSEAGADAPVFKIKNDPRVTPIGRFLRKTSLDELPQFINVLMGDMSIVGPRPPIPYEFEKYDIWHRERLLKMKPGITGLWQVKGRSSTSFDEMVRLDVKYLRTWSFWRDIKIILMTPWVMVKGKGAY